MATIYQDKNTAMCEDVPGQINCIEVKIYVSEEISRSPDPYLVIQERLKTRHPIPEESPLCGFDSFEDAAIFNFFDFRKMERELGWIQKVLSK